MQPHGALIAFDGHWIASHASDNIHDFLGQRAEALIGQPLADLLPEDLVHDIRTRLQTIAGSDLGIGLRAIALPGGTADLTLSATGDTTLIEIEPHADTAMDGEMSLIAPLLLRLPEDGEEPAFLTAVARSFRALTGFDRVMVYRFAADGSGEVTGEVHASDMEPYLGLRYPRTDIPRQARALLLRSPVRLIADVTDEGRPVIGRGDLDLSLSGIRAVSPIHLQYLRNMGVASTMTVSLVVDGALWGLISCHHRSPRVVPMALRGAAALLGQMVAQRIGLRQARADLALIARSQGALEALRDSPAPDPAAQLDAVVGLTGDLIAADTHLLLCEGALFQRGATLEHDTARDLATRLVAAASGQVWHSDALAAALPGGAPAPFAGALVLPLAKGHALILLRQELAQTIRWAGAPQKPGDAQGRLTPRASFAAWEEEVAGRSAPWQDHEIKTATPLRAALLELTLQRHGATSSALRRANDSQEIVISELNHRVRNIFALMRSVVQQSDGDDPQALRGAILSRIDALARAHEQLTEAEPRPLSQLLNTEAGAFADGAARLALEGPDHCLSAEAAPTMALVLHELVTNAVKHGALSVPGGAARLRARALPEGGLALDWAETGGPAVAAPTRKGFGRTIIEGTVPYELGGTAELDFDPRGVRARFTLPAAHVSPCTAPPPPPPEPADTAPPPALEALRLLLVEDNMLIGLDVVDGLKRLGAGAVALARSLAEGQEMARATPPDLAILDVHLGGESALELARDLAARGCPLILATGQGQAEVARAGFPEAPIIQKPYDVAALAQLVTRLRPGG